ncbi:MAG: hypothetical protein A2Z70_00710 [Chloroflexi bacterium RBG_13_48_17]|nr:MAG: hypothetical protein A2Z70_00710 [Chloroflexi bacterium RBG_13_48_17]
MQTSDFIQENTVELAAVFSALADPTRLKLLRLLSRQHDPNALCVSTLASVLGVTQSNVSQHLRVLKVIGLVRGERRGYYTHYFVNLEALEHYRKLVADSLSVGSPLKESLCRNNCRKVGR